MVGLVIVGVALLFLYAALWIGGFLLMAVVEVGELVMAFLMETVGRVLGVTFGDKAKTKHFPRLMGLGAGFLVGGSAFLCLVTQVTLPLVQGIPMKEWMYFWVPLLSNLVAWLLVAFLFGWAANGAIQNAVRDYQREKYAKRKKE